MLGVFTTRSAFLILGEDYGGELTVEECVIYIPG